MVKGKTSSGFVFTVDRERVTNDYRFTLAIAKSNSKDMMKQIEADAEIVSLLLGEEQTQRLFEHVQEKDGMIPRDKVTAEVMEIMKSLGEEEKK